MDRDEVEVNKLAEKERGQYPAILTEQTWSIKDLLYGFWERFSCGIHRVVPSGQDGSILPASTVLCYVAKQKGSSFEKDNKASVLFNIFQRTVSRFFNVQC